ncbi:MAG: DMT family transporter [Chloroflexi bacterium]|nr:DMT family transporter [Chloroflexota bacterium]
MVTQSIVFGLLAAFGWGVSDFVAALIAKRVGILRTAFGVHLSSVSVTTIYLLLAPSLSLVSATQWVVLAGVATLGFVTYLCFYKALQLGPIAIVSPIVGAYAMIVILLAVVVTGERLSGIQIIAVSASIGGVVLTSLNLRNLKNRQRLIGKGALYGLVAMVGLGLSQYSIGILSRDMGWFLPIYVSRLFTFAMLAPVSLIWRQLPWQRLTVLLGVGVAFAGITETAGLFAFSRGTEIGVISIVAAASTIYPILPVLGGLLIFRERLSPNQWAGLVIAMAGLLILAASA